MMNKKARGYVRTSVPMELVLHANTQLVSVKTFMSAMSAAVWQTFRGVVIIYGLEDAFSPETNGWNEAAKSFSKMVSQFLATNNHEIIICVDNEKLFTLLEKEQPFMKAE